MPRVGTPGLQVCLGSWGPGGGSLTRDLEQTSVLPGCERGDEVQLVGTRGAQRQVGCAVCVHG